MSELTELDGLARSAIHANLRHEHVSVLVDEDQASFDSRASLVNGNLHHLNLANIQHNRCRSLKAQLQMARHCFNFSIFAVKCSQVF